MKAYVYHGRHDARLEDIPIPGASPGEVVIKVSLACICRTDLHILEGKFPVKPGTVDFSPLITHTVNLREIEKGYEVYGKQKDNVMKVAVKS